MYKSPKNGIWRFPEIGVPQIIHFNTLFRFTKKRWKITICYGKMMGKPWENGDLYRTSPCFQWVNQLFRLGHIFVL